MCVCVCVLDTYGSCIGWRLPRQRDSVVEGGFLSFFLLCSFRVVVADGCGASVTIDAVKGQGMDRHLFALRNLALEVRHRPRRCRSFCPPSSRAVSCCKISQRVTPSPGHRAQIFYKCTQRTAAHFKRRSFISLWPPRARWIFRDGPVDNFCLKAMFGFVRGRPADTKRSYFSRPCPRMPDRRA